jgi:hypothetical protein
MPTLTAEQAFTLACDHVQRGRHADAEALCRDILRAVPAHRDALLLMATLAQRAGDRAAGDEWLRQAMAVNARAITIAGTLDARPRWAPHAAIEALLERGIERYRETLATLAPCLPWLEKIARDADPQQPEEPHWNNIWMPVLDAAALYALVATRRPRRYVEIGSGNSTRFVARAIADHRLDTEIISIDPQPRAEIDALCDMVIRTPLEACDPALFRTLGAGDIVFADNSHQSFMNSDVTVFFCEILPALAAGVIAGIHDIFLPDDYPAEWSGRYYSEQYLLACWLLAGTTRFDVMLPVHFAQRRGLCAPLVPQAAGVGNDPPRYSGSAFWLQMR